MWNLLHAETAAPDRADKMMLYGRFVGAWRGRAVVHLPEGGTRESIAEVSFAWVLEGRAIQDVWRAPADVAPEARRMYGTTLRVYDPSLDHWRITWIDPVPQIERRMIGRAVGADIVQEYVEAGVRTQWCFTDITDASFHWLARASPTSHDAWVVAAEFFLHRV